MIMPTISMGSLLLLLSPPCCGGDVVVGVETVQVVAYLLWW